MEGGFLYKLLHYGRGNEAEDGAHDAYLIGLIHGVLPVSLLRDAEQCSVFACQLTGYVKAVSGSREEEDESFILLLKGLQGCFLFTSGCDSTPCQEGLS